MPVIRSPVQVVFADLLTIYTADTNKLGQGTTDVKATSFVREDDRTVMAMVNPPCVKVRLQYEDLTGKQGQQHGVVTGTMTIETRQARGSSEADEIEQGLRDKFDGVNIAVVGDTDWQPDACVLQAMRPVVRGDRTLRVIPFRVYVRRVGATGDKPQLDGTLARLTYTPGSGGVQVAEGTVEDIGWSIGGGAIDMTPETAPDNDVMAPGALGGSFELRCKVTGATAASSGTPNPRIPDGVVATLVVYKNGTSGQSWSQSVFIESVRYSAPRDGGQMVYYRLRRAGASTETLQ